MGGPYPSRIWQLGGKPTPGTDIPATAIFLALYMLGAATHMTIFQKNRRRGHKFLFSAMLFGEFARNIDPAGVHMQRARN